MFRIKNLMAFLLLSAAFAFSSCSEDTTMDEVDGSQLTQPYEGSNDDNKDRPGGG